MKEYCRRFILHKMRVGPYIPGYEARLRGFDLELLKYHQVMFVSALCLKLV